MRGRRGGPPRAGRALAPELSVVGTHAVAAVLTHQPQRAERLFVEDAARAAPLVELARRAGVAVEVRGRGELDPLVEGDLPHQGSVLACRAFPFVSVDDVDASDDALGLVLDGVEDPRNLGAATRAAFALGATFVGIPRRHAAQPTASAHKASTGALARVPVVAFDNLRRGLDRLKERGFWIVGAEADGPEAPWQVDLQGRIVLVVGGEDQGLRRLTREACDHVVHIPMAAADMSLNAADAATVLLYEARRQRLAARTEARAAPPGVAPGPPAAEGRRAK